MPLSFSAGVRDSLWNLAASLGVGKDKAAYDAFGLRTLERAQIEAMYRGDWLARKTVDIVPYDSIRAWRAWSGHRADVDRMEAAERRLGLRKVLQRAMTLGRLYGGGAILIGTGETDPAALARPLDERLPRGGLAFLHVVSRWQLGVAALDKDPLSPWVGEPALYELSAPGRPALALHPSRVVRFLGHPLPDPTLSPTFWSDSVLQVLYDAIHAVALTTTGATSLMHEAKVDIVTVPNLSEHLSSAETTQQLSARFAYAAAMKSINNLLLLGDGETWSRQSVDFGGLPEMVRTFLQVAAGAADIPVTRLLGQSPAGLSATGDSDTRNYYDMIAARQELDLRPQLERLDRLIARSEGIDPGALTFAFRPLWQLDAPSQAALALQKAQATQIYAGLKLWPDAVTARLVEAQLVADGTYPNAAAMLAQPGVTADAGRTRTALDFDPAQPRDPWGRWTSGGIHAPPPGPSESGSGLSVASTTSPSDQPSSAASAGTPSDLSHQTGTGATVMPSPVDPAAREDDPEAAAVALWAAPSLLAPLYLYQTARRAVRALAQHLPDWLTGGPPADPPSFPRLAGAGSTEPPRSTAIRPWPLTPQSGASPSFNEQADEPPKPGTHGASEALASIEIPGNLRLEAQGKTAQEQGNFFAEEVRKALNFNTVPPPQGGKYKIGDSAPDGVFSDPQTGLQIALEVKYFSKVTRGINDPDNMLKFIIDGNVAQARKYIDKFKGGLLWIVNDRELVYKYDYFFQKSGLSGFRIDFIESK